VAETTSDPVRYDAQAETERLARVDQHLARTEATRDRRIEDEEDARQARQIRSIGGLIGIGATNQRWMNACGRG
jgi:hypothetical protein